MSAYKWLSIIMIGIVIATGAASTNAGELPVKNTGQGEKPIIGNQGVMIETEELTPLTSTALEGSPEVALRLYLFYEFGSYDESESLFWTRIAAENGSPVGQFSLWQRLRVSQDTRDQKRALFWLRRSAQAGNPRAMDALKVWEDKQKAKP